MGITDEPPQDIGEIDSQHPAIFNKPFTLDKKIIIRSEKNSDLYRGQ